MKIEADFHPYPDETPKETGGYLCLYDNAAEWGTVRQWRILVFTVTSGFLPDAWIGNILGWAKLPEEGTAAGPVGVGAGWVVLPG